MTTFKKVTIIAFISQIIYWLLAAVIFGRGQLILHVSAAIVGAAYITTQLLKNRRHLLWFAPFLWAGLAAFCYALIMGMAAFTNWTLDVVIARNLWDIVRVLDITFVSVLIGGIAVLVRRFYQKDWTSL